MVKRSRECGDEQTGSDRQNRAVEELKRGCELTAKLQALMILAPVQGWWSAAAGAALDELFQSMRTAMSMFQPPDELRNECSSSSDNHKSRKKQHSWSVTTVAPFDDGYQWRKYGEKNIKTEKFARCYFRCSYKEDRGCQAMKQVQQRDAESYVVTYTNPHTCKQALTMTADSYLAEQCVLDFESTGGDAVGKDRTLISKQSPCTIIESVSDERSNTERSYSKSISPDLSTPAETCQDWDERDANCFEIDSLDFEGASGVVNVL